MASTRAAARLESLRRHAAPLVALLASTLALCCLVTVPRVVTGWRVLGAVEAAPAAWAGLAVLLGVSVAVITLMGANRFGPGPPLALGVVSALLGLGLSDDVDSGPQLVLALLVLAVASAALVCSGPCLLEELGEAAARRAFVAWLLPLAGGWGLIGWLTLRSQAAGVATLGLHTPTRLLGAGAAVVLGWAVLSLLLEPPRPRSPVAAGWENAWAGLGVLVAAVCCVVMLVGFQPHSGAAWVRPVVLLTTGVTLCGLLACARLVPDEGTWPSYVALAIALLVGPVCLHLLTLVSWQARGDLPWWSGVALAVAGLAGCWLGLRAPRVTLAGGLLVMALAVAAGWVMPSDPVWMSACAAPLALGLASSVASALQVAASRSRMALRFVTAGGVAALALGLLAAAPLAWALGAPLTGAYPAAREGGRVLLGLSFALLVLGAAAVSVLVVPPARTPVVSPASTPVVSPASTRGEAGGDRGRPAGEERTGRYP